LITGFSWWRSRNYGLGGGGGGGGHRSSFPGGTKITVNRAETTITIGAGGTAATPGSAPTVPGSKGVNSSIGAYIVSTGGGAANTTQGFPAVPNTDPTNIVVSSLRKNPVFN